MAELAPTRKLKLQKKALECTELVPPPVSIICVAQVAPFLYLATFGPVHLDLARPVLSPWGLTVSLPVGVISCTIPTWIA